VASEQSIILHFLYNLTHLSPPHEVCVSPDQAAYYHTVGPNLGASSATRCLAGLGVKAFFIYGDILRDVLEATRLSLI
jgi:hypothetical protein